MKNHLIFPVLFFLLIFLCCQKDPTGITPGRNIWVVSTPASQQMNQQILEAGFTEAKSTGYIDGLLIIRYGNLVAEKYFNGYSAYTPHNIKSVSKSFLSAITGLALQQGFINSLEEKMLDYFPDNVYAGMEPEKYNITLRHLLTMRMGIQRESDDDYQVYQNLYNSNNWIQSTIEMPLIFDPGERMRYNTFQTHLLSAIISKAANMSTRDFTQEHLCKPLDIDIDDWERGPQGYHFGGNAMAFTPREMAVLGYLYLNNGKWKGRQIVPQDWVSLTIAPSTDFTHPNEWGELKNYNYGYLWWLGEIGGYEIFMGLGYGGQYVIVFLQLELIVVSTARGEIDPDTAGIQEWKVLDIVVDYILAAVED